MLLGAVLGVVAGALIAFFVMPRVFDHYFGTADIFAGETYTGDAKVMQLDSIQRIPDAQGNEYPGLFAATFTVTTNKTWAPSPDDFVLSLGIGTRVEGLGLELNGAVPELGVSLPLGSERQLVVFFPGTERRDAEPRSVHLREPDVRFHVGERKH
jgi:hypothetical protein